MGLALDSSITDATHHLLENIQTQFALSDDTLVTITRQFVDDFKLGLGRYNEAMAMM